MLMGSTYKSGFNGLGRYAFGLGDSTNYGALAPVEGFSPPQIAAEMSATRGAGNSPSPASILEQAMIPDVVVTPTVVNQITANGGAGNYQQYYRDPNNGQLLDAASLIMRSVQAAANGQSYSWRQTLPIIVIAQMDSQQLIDSANPALLGNFNQPSTKFYNISNPAVANIVAQLPNASLPGSDFYKSQYSLSNASFTDGNGNMPYGGTSGTSVYLKALYAASQGKTLPQGSMPLGNSGQLAAGTSGPPASGGQPIGTTWLQANQGAVTNFSQWVAQQQALPLSQRDPNGINTLIAWGYTPTQAGQIMSVPQQAASPASGSPANPASASSGGSLTAPTGCPAGAVCYPGTNIVSSYIPTATMDRWGNTIGTPIVPAVPLTTQPAASTMSLTTYEPTADQSMPAPAPGTVASRLTTPGSSNSTLMSSSVSPVDSSAVSSNPVVSNMQMSSTAAPVPATASTDYVTGAESWVQQNSLLAVGIAAGLMFLLGRSR